MDPESTAKKICRNELIISSDFLIHAKKQKRKYINQNFPNLEIAKVTNHFHRVEGIQEKLLHNNSKTY